MLFLIYKPFKPDCIHCIWDIEGRLLQNIIIWYIRNKKVIR